MDTSDVLHICTESISTSVIRLPSEWEVDQCISETFWGLKSYTTPETTPNRFSFQWTTVFRTDEGAAQYVTWLYDPRKEGCEKDATVGASICHVDEAGWGLKWVLMAVQFWLSPTWWHTSHKIQCWDEARRCGGSDLSVAVNLGRFCENRQY